MKAYLFLSMVVHPVIATHLSIYLTAKLFSFVWGWGCLHEDTANCTNIFCVGSVVFLFTYFFCTYVHMVYVCFKTKC